MIMNRHKIKNWSKAACLSAISVILLFVSFWIVGMQRVFEIFSQFSFLVILFITLGFLINVFIVAFRFQRLLNFCNCYLGYRTVFKANIQGNFAALFLMALFGQAVGRQFVLQKHNVSVLMTTTLTGFERALIFLVSSTLALISGLFLDYKAVLIFIERISVLEILFISLLAISTSFIFGRSPLEKKLFANTISWKNVLRFSELTVVTFFSQVFVVGGFVIGAMFIAPNENLIHLIAASVVVSFVASLPISVNGWGVRELAAVFTFGHIGIEPSAAMALSILIGLIATAVVLTIYPLRNFGSKAKVTLKNPIKAFNLKTDGTTSEQIMCWALGMATAVFVFFQIQIPLHASRINVNLADLFAIVALAVLAFKQIILSERANWIVPRFTMLLSIIGLLLLFSFLHGVISFGVTPWAFSNRLIGWFVLMGYLSVGVLMNSYFGNIGVRRFVETLVVTAVSIIIIQIILRSFGLVDFSEMPNFQGYSGNRNAFAFQLLVCFSLALSFFGAKQSGYSIYESHFSSRKFFSIVSAVIIVGIIFTGSRAGLLSGVTAFLVAWFVNPIQRPLMLRTLFLALLLWVGFDWLLPEIFNLTKYIFSLFTSINDYPVALQSLQSSFSSEQSNLERWQSIALGFKMFKASPIFGSGLGAFYHFSEEWMGKRDVIHSTPVWILAEFGLFGAAIFLAILYWLLRSIFKIGFQNQRAQAAITILVIFLVFGVFHEIFYQRIFWLALGLTLSVISSDAFKLKAKS